jgi:hypothetical protein
MKQIITGLPMPTAQICINKSRLKVYNKESVPTYYLTKGQEFQIELYNPTSDTILAKIYLNGRAISQGGLVLRPAERVFLERYLDIAKKFLFDTYEVANTAEAQKAIEENGDFKVEFYKESQPAYNYNTTYTVNNPWILNGGIGYNNTINSNLTNLIGISTTTFNTSEPFNASQKSTLNEVTQDQMLCYNEQISKAKMMRSLKPKKTIETGRVEAGSQSNQRIETVSKSFDYFPFYSLEYKMLPMSQKINTVQDINVKRYCHNCGAKQKPEFKFCPSCGTKA